MALGTYKHPSWEVDMTGPTSIRIILRYGDGPRVANLRMIPVILII